MTHKFAFRETLLPLSEEGRSLSQNVDSLNISCRNKHFFMLQHVNKLKPNFILILH